MFPAICLLLMLVTPAVLAQTGTPNLYSPYVVDTEDGMQWDADARFWSGSRNTDIYLGLRGRVDERTEATLGFTAIENRGDDPIGGAGGSISAVRTSHYHAVTAQFKVRLGNSTQPAVALIVGADFPVSPRRSTNTETGAIAWSRGPILSLCLPLQWGTDEDRTLWFFEPKVAFFDSLWETDQGTPIDGFGTIIALGGGVVHRVGKNLSLFADVAAVVSGDNSIDKHTARVDDEVLWSAGGRWQPGDTIFVEVFATDAAGPSLPTSLIAAPGGSVGFGFRAGCQY